MPLLPPLHRAARSPRRRTRIGTVIPRIAGVAILAVAASFLAAPSPSFADTAPPVDAIRASLDSHTYLQDVESGRITIDQIVAVTLAARTAEARAGGSSVPSVAALREQTAREVADLRAGSAPVDALDAEQPAESPAVVGPVAADKHWWNKLIHWKTFRVPAFNLAVVGATAGATFATMLGGCALMPSVVCAVVVSISATSSLALSGLAATCLEHEQHYVYVKVPDFWKSHCGD